MIGVKKLYKTYKHVFSNFYIIPDWRDVPVFWQKEWSRFFSLFVTESASDSDTQDLLKELSFPFYTHENTGSFDQWIKTARDLDSSLAKEYFEKWCNEQDRLWRQPAAEKIAALYQRIALLEAELEKAKS